MVIINKPMIFSFFDEIGVGIDIVEIKRFETLLSDNDFIKRIFTRKEADYCFKSKSPAQHFAVRFACKEAVYKALSQLGVHHTEFKDIEIIPTAKNPEIKINSKKLFVVKISLSHSETSAIAIAIIKEIKNETT